MSDINNKEKSYNRDFIYTVPAKVFNDNDLTLNDLKIYMMIRSFMDTSGDAYPSNNWVSDSLNMHRVTVIRCINRLIKKGYIIKNYVNGTRHLSIKITSLPQKIIAPIPSSSDHTITPPSDHTITKKANHLKGNHLVAPALPPSSASATPPSSASATQLDQTLITSKSINTYVDFSEKGGVDNFDKSKQTKEKTGDAYKTHSLFMKFYNAYPNKQKPKEAYKAFLKHNPDKAFLEKLLKDINNRCEKDRRWKTKQYIPHPENYLNSDYWLGDVIVENKKSHRYPTKAERIENDKKICEREEKAAQLKREEIEGYRRLNGITDFKTILSGFI